VNAEDVPDTIDVAENLNRRLKPVHVDEIEKRPLAVAFDGTPPHEISVDRAKYRSTADTLAGNEGFGICSVNAGVAASITGIMPRADKQADNPAHALIELNADWDAGKRLEVVEGLARASRLVVAPDQELFNQWRARRKAMSKQAKK